LMPFSYNEIIQLSPRTCEEHGINKHRVSTMT
jgi:hypothetical protein